MGFDYHDNGQYFGQCIKNDVDCEPCENGVVMNRDADDRCKVKTENEERHKLCATCSLGFHLTEDSQCKPNHCLCETGKDYDFGDRLNGHTPKEGTQCQYNDEENCASCNSGYHLENIVLNLKSTHYETLNEKDDDGHAVVKLLSAEKREATDYSATICKPNTCFCKFGDPYLFSDENDSDESDSTISTSFKSMCPKNQIQLGSPQKCKECLPGYHKLVSFGETSDGNHYYCEINACYCENGTPKEDVRDDEGLITNQIIECTDNGSHMCASCDPYFHLEADQNCVENVCTCENGEAVDNVDCIEHESNQCKEDDCEGGYHTEPSLEIEGALDCKLNLCYCWNGDGAEGWHNDDSTPYTCDHTKGQQTFSCVPHSCRAGYEYKTQDELASGGTAISN